MRYSVSDTAEYGDYTRGPRVIDDIVKQEMEQILSEIQDGTFAKEWILENQAGRPVYNALKRMEAEHPIELVGADNAYCKIDPEKCHPEFCHMLPLFITGPDINGFHYCNNK